jgi:hypothetical protein
LSPITGRLIEVEIVSLKEGNEDEEEEDVRFVGEDKS